MLTAKVAQQQLFLQVLVQVVSQVASLSAQQEQLVVR